MKPLHIILLITISWSAPTSAISQQTLKASLGELFSSEKVLYTAELVLREGEPFFQLRPASEVAEVADKWAAFGIEDAQAQSASFVADLNKPVPPNSVELQILSRNLVYDALRNSIDEPEADWIKKGLSIGFAEDTITALSLNAAREYFDGTVFVTSSEELAQKSVKFANYSDDTVAGLSVARMKEIAQEATDRLFAEAARAGCNTKPRPREITPSVSVAFNFFAGATFEVSATYVVADICRELGID